ncbi:hypothetical protein [Micromonospora inositola]|uniref:PH domain-containing protein n=1 Tax=Micromonospora inositola TaxID=47865 RepID=A0A1C5IKB4_9ACTN|nr:hypothetical protein [Micromonospora inositola]SCG58798.1 hypothetical protein GA0070613_3007 [Micromonospora inositola]
MDADESAAGPGGTSTPPGAVGWSGRRVPGSAILGMVLILVAALCVLAGTVAAVRAGDWATVVVGGVAAVLLASVFGFLVVVGSSRGRSGPAPALTPWPGGGTSGVRFGYSTATYVWFSALLATCILIFLAMALAAGTSGTVFGWMVAVVMAGVAVLLGWFLVTMLRLAPGELVLSPAGIAHRGLTHLYAVPWSAVFAVEAQRLGTPVIVVKAYPSEESVLRRHTGRLDTGELRFVPFLVVRTYWLAADPETVLRALTFYDAHPELRDELATPDAVARIAEGRVVDRP